jgi:hypothetical protein
MIDRKKLEAELLSSIAKDTERKAVDTMKKRAILSASSYDEFKNLVACANLQPLSRDDFAKRAAVSVNHGLARASAAPPRGATSLHSSGALPRSPGEFDREWRRIGKAPESRLRCVHSRIIVLVGCRHHSFSGMRVHPCIPCKCRQVAVRMRRCRRPARHLPC